MFKFGLFILQTNFLRDLIYSNDHKSSSNNFGLFYGPTTIKYIDVLLLSTLNTSAR